MGTSINLYSSNQVRELDFIAIEDFGIQGIVLMKRAAQATFKALLKSYPATKTITVVCGTGNNGGDGFIIAILALEAKLKVNLIQLGNEDSIKGDALSARNAYLKTGAKSLAFDKKLLEVDVVIDAIFGTGLDRDVKGDWADAITAINHSPARIVSVDIPSGLNADTGRVLGVAIQADLCITFIGMKCGLLTGQARDYTGKLEFDSLDMPAEVYQQLSDPVNKSLIPESIIQQTLHPRLYYSNKGNFGHILFIGGAAGMSGAIRLAAEAGLRTGAGLVTVATHPSHADSLNLNRPELMVNPVQQSDQLKPLLEKASVIAIGPGLGKSKWAQGLLALVLTSNKPKVLDADALNLLALQSDINLANNNWVLTPHPAEAARLLNIETALIEKNRYQSIADLQEKYQGVCVLKGAGSMVSDGVYIKVCDAGNPGMASGGMGDVLTGVIAALVAQGLSLFDAASAGVYVHAKAADFAAKKGERGLLASDLFPYLRMQVNNVTSDD